MKFRYAELAGFAHNPDTQVDFLGRGERLLERLKETPTRPASSKPLRRIVRAAVKDVNRLQHEYLVMYAKHLMPYYEALTDALANHACETLALIEQLEADTERAG